MYDYLLVNTGEDETIVMDGSTSDNEPCQVAIQYTWALWDGYEDIIKRDRKYRVNAKNQKHYWGGMQVNKYNNEGLFQELSLRVLDSCAGHYVGYHEIRIDFDTPHYSAAWGEDARIIHDCVFSFDLDFDEVFQVSTSNHCCEEEVLDPMQPIVFDTVDVGGNVDMDIFGLYQGRLRSLYYCGMLRRTCPDST